jgi:hypothetical protein
VQVNKMMISQTKYTHYQFKSLDVHPENLLYLK